MQVGGVFHMTCGLKKFVTKNVHSKFQTMDLRVNKPVVLTAWVSGLWFYRNVGKFALYPGIQGTVDGKVQWLETSDNKVYKAR